MVESKENGSSSNNTNPPDPASLLSENDYESNKIFAGGLCRSTTEEQLKCYFEAYGQVTESEIVKDKITGRSRGFGFVTFASKDVVNEVLSKQHIIKGLEIEVKLAVRKEKSKILAPKYDESKRIFVGGISEKITESYFRDYFGRYGPISSYNYLMDKRTNKPRGYGFVIYEHDEDAQKSVGTHASLGRFCEAKFAYDKSDKFQNNFQNFDYSAFYYAQANLLYSQYLSQMYNGYSSDSANNGRADDKFNFSADSRFNNKFNRSRESSVDSNNREYPNNRNKRHRSRSPNRDQVPAVKGKRRFRH